MEAKAPNPRQLLDDQTVLDLIRVYFDVCHLKQLYRKGWLQRGIPPTRCESVADHTFAVALIAMFLADRYSPELDPCKILRLALLHDLGEVHTGDLTPADGVTDSEKIRRESEAAERIFGGLENGEKYLELWREHVEMRSPEAIFVHQVEKVEMALQASVYEHQGFGRLADFYQSASKSAVRPELRRLLEGLLDLRQNLPGQDECGRD